MKKLKIVVCILILVLTLASLTACVRAYHGLHPELYIVAVNNLFGARGYSGHGEHLYDPNIDVIEVDDYGRVLFFYDEVDHVGGVYHTAIVIMQKSDSNYVYYYQDDCYWPYFGEETSSLVGYRNLFSDEEIDALKELNDWNKEIDLNKCTKASCDILRPRGSLEIKQKEMEKMVKSTGKKLGYNISGAFPRYSFCNADKYGRELYCVYDFAGSLDGSPSNEESLIFAMIFNPDKTCPIENVYVITDKKLAFDALKQLKQTVGWNQPYSKTK